MPVKIDNTGSPLADAFTGFFGGAAFGNMMSKPAKKESDQTLAAKYQAEVEKMNMQNDARSNAYQWHQRNPNASPQQLRHQAYMGATMGDRDLPDYSSVDSQGLQDLGMGEVKFSGPGYDNWKSRQEAITGKDDAAAYNSYQTGMNTAQTRGDAEIKANALQSFAGEAEEVGTNMYSTVPEGINLESAVLSGELDAGDIWAKEPKPGVEVNLNENEPPYKLPSGYMLADEDDYSKGVKKIPGVQNPATDSAKIALLRSGKDSVVAARDLILDDNGNVDKTIIAQLTAGNYMGMAGLPFTDSRELYVNLYDAIEAKLRAESGAAVPETEVVRIAKRLVPNIFDRDSTMKSKLAKLEMFMDYSLEQIYSGQGGIPSYLIKGGQGYKPYDPNATRKPWDVDSHISKGGQPVEASLQPDDSLASEANDEVIDMIWNNIKKQNPTMSDDQVDDMVMEVMGDQL